MSLKFKALPFVALFNGRTVDTRGPNCPAKFTSQASQQADQQNWDGAALRKGVNFIRRYFIIFGSISLLLAVTSMANARDITRTVDVDSSFGEGSVAWNETSYGMHYRVQIIVINDILELCGAFGYDGPTRYRPLTDQLLRYAKLFMNNKSILSDFRFFRKGSLSKPWEGQKADCVSTGVVAPVEQPEFEIKFRNITYRGG